MENHPIPQDVTGFQFKLIGNLTVKQFAYLATGTVLAILLLQLPVPILIKFPFGAIAAFLGIGLAYLPVGGRPMDLMITYYIRALIRPTMFVYEVTSFQASSPSTSTPVPTLAPDDSLGLLPKDKLKEYLKAIEVKPKNKLDERENSFLMSITNLVANPAPVQHRRISGLDLQNVELQINPQPFQPSIIETDNAPKPLEPKIASPQAQPTKTVVPPEPVITFSPAMPSLLPTLPPAPIASTMPISKPVEPQTPSSFSQTVPALKPALPKPITPPPAAPIKPVLRVLRAIAKPAAPTSPNLITGVTRDARGNAVSNILVEVKDKDNNPVRAFKTNAVGRFASATPLASGIYTVEFDDPKAQNTFEKITINVTGQIIMPIEAISVDTREELRRSLFATNTPAQPDTQTN
jgi:hypothetical protein